MPLLGLSKSLILPNHKVSNGLKRRCASWVRIVTCSKVNHIAQHMYRRVWYSHIKIDAQGVTKPHQWLCGKPYMSISSWFKFHERNKTIFDQFFTLSKKFLFCNTISAIWFYIRVDRKNWHLRECLHWAPPICSNSIVSNQSSFASVIAALSQRWCWRSVYTNLKLKVKAAFKRQ